MSDEKAILNVTRGTVVCERGILADRPLARMRGLLGARALRAEQGLLLSPAPSIHTAFMRFPIDVVFLDRDSVVVRVIEELPPWRAAAARGARAALELAAGESSRRGVRVGDWLIRVSEDLMWRDPAHALAPDEPAAEGSCQARERVQEGADVLEGELRELLLVSRDRRFRAVMAVLLSGRGFAVTLAGRLPDRPDPKDVGAEVVVIDAGDSLEAVMDEATAAGWMSCDRVAFFVTEGPEARGNLPRVARKWESPERLCDEIASSRVAHADLHAERVRAGTGGGATP